MTTSYAVGKSENLYYNGAVKQITIALGCSRRGLKTAHRPHEAAGR